MSIETPGTEVFILFLDSDSLIHEVGFQISFILFTLGSLHRNGIGTRRNHPVRPDFQAACGVLVVEPMEE